jgi:2-polyprenyl-3-methyl-5-hydroxy-6-metoxy-1,4-benzoquinol methylase
MVPQPALRQLPPLDVRVPQWDAEGLAERACPFCNGPGEQAFVRPDGLSARACASCGAFFISPAPTEEALNHFYATYFSAHSRHGIPTEATARWLRSMDPLHDMRIREISSLVHLRGKRVLDIGCGEGLTLAPLKALGADVSGVDLDPNAIRFIQNHLGIPDVRCGTVDSLPDGERYDVIILNDVIEHPLDPAALLRKAAARLNPGGLLSLWTPNAESVAGSVQPVMFRVDLEHMQYLSGRTCHMLARGLGLEVVHLETVGQPNVRAVENRAPRGKPFVKRLISKMPGYGRITRLRFALQQAAAQDDGRTGAYNLFCILRKPATGPVEAPDGSGE